MRSFRIDAWQKCMCRWQYAACDSIAIATMPRARGQSYWSRGRRARGRKRPTVWLWRDMWRGFLFEIDVTAFYFPSSQKLYDTAVALARQPSRDTCADTYTNVTSALSMPSIWNKSNEKCSMLRFVFYFIVVVVATDALDACRSCYLSQRWQRLMLCSATFTMFQTHILFGLPIAAVMKWNKTFEWESFIAFTSRYPSTFEHSWMWETISREWNKSRKRNR